MSTTRTQSSFVTSLKQCVLPFGWSIDPNKVDELNDAEQFVIKDFVERMERPGAAIAVSQQLPGCFWSPVLLPVESQRKFLRTNDAKAFIVFMLSRGARFFFWRNLAGETMSDDCLIELLMDYLPSLGREMPTPFGFVFSDCCDTREFEEFRFWFGRRAGRMPALEGAEILTAVRDLFSIGNL